MPRSVVPSWFQLTGHEPYQGAFVHGFVTVGEPLVVPDEASAAHQPAQRAFHHPAAGQHRETTLIGRLAHDLNDDPEHAAGPVQEPTGVAAVGEDPRDAGHREPPPVQQALSPVVVLCAGRGDQYDQQRFYHRLLDGQITRVRFVSFELGLRVRFTRSATKCPESMSWRRTCH